MVQCVVKPISMEDEPAINRNNSLAKRLTTRCEFGNLRERNTKSEVVRKVLVSGQNGNPQVVSGGGRKMEGLFELGTEVSVAPVEVNQVC